MLKRSFYGIPATLISVSNGTSGMMRHLMNMALSPLSVIITIIVTWSLNIIGKECSIKS